MRQKMLTKKDVAVTIGCVVLLMMTFCAIGGNGHQIAKSIICKSNLMNIGRAEIEYTKDNNGQFSDSMDWLTLSNFTVMTQNLPPLSSDWRCRWHDANSGIANRPDLAGQLWPYIATEKIFVCDNFRAIADQHGQDHIGHNPNVPIKPQHSYVQNFFIGDTGSFGNGIFSWTTEYDAPRVSDVKRPPAEVFMFSEENTWMINTRYGYEYNWSNDAINDTALIPFWSDIYNICDAFATYHKTSDQSGARPVEGYANAVFVDGHVEEVLNWDTNNPQTKSERRNLLKLSDPIGWYDSIYPD